MKWDANTKIIRDGRLQGKAEQKGELMLGNNGNLKFASYFAQVLDLPW